MKIVTVDGQDYRLPGRLNPFQQDMYIHLTNWKWEHVTREPGHHGGRPYDVILPAAYADRYPMLYPPIVDALEGHLEKFPFRIHKFFNHMASSQAANLNLFLPVLRHPQADAVLAALRPDFARLAVEQLDHGYRVEFWDEPYGNLGDKSKVSGTDADIAIAYYNHQDELCLWLIEHKLTEKEFTVCGGFKSKGRQPRHDCKKRFADILADKHLCYYHDVCHFTYWDITARHQAFFANHDRYAHCPFQGGMNQLWRNQLLGLSIEGDPRQPYQHASFAVLKHPENTALDDTLATYQGLIANHPKFSVLTSADVIAAAAAVNDPDLNRWIAWYKELYKLCNNMRDAD
jgi:hypothetical protein